MARKDIVVVGASAGGMEALQKLVSHLPPDLPAALFIVWHLSPGAKSILPQILSKSGPLKAVHPQDGDPIEPGRIYVAPNDHHMLLEKDYIRIARGPKENRFRPAVDPLFRSAAYVYGPRTIGVVLSGALDDGTAGLWTIKLRGGTAIVQEPAEALIRSMPLNALDNVAVDHKLPAAEIGTLIGRLVREPAPAAPRVPEIENEKTKRELRIAKERDALEEGLMNFGELSPFTCPECHGVLSTMREGRIVRVRFPARLQRRGARGAAVGRGARLGRERDPAQPPGRGIREKRQHRGGGEMLRRGARRARLNVQKLREQAG